MVDLSSLGTTEWKDLDIAKLMFFTSVFTLLDNAIMFPFWSLKTRAQVERGTDFSVFHKSASSSGIRSLYRGFMFYSVASMPAYLVYLTTYTWSKSALGFHYEDGNNKFNQIMIPLAAGILADAACLGFYVPVDIIVQRLQLPGRYGSFTHVLKDLWDQQGLRGFYRGFGATVATSAISSGVWWLAYENIKRELGRIMLPPPQGLPQEKAHSSQSLPSRKLSRPVVEPNTLMGDAVLAVQRSLPHMLSGFIAGGTAAFVANPLDVVKTRLQTQQGKPGAFSFIRGLQSLVKEEGLRGAFLRGFVPKLITMAPLGMLSSVIYESILYLSRKTPEQLAADELKKARR